MSDFDISDVSGDAIAWALYRIGGRRGPNPAHVAECCEWDANAQCDPLTGAVVRMKFTRLSDDAEHAWTVDEVRAEAARREGRS